MKPLGSQFLDSTHKQLVDVYRLFRFEPNDAFTRNQLRVAISNILDRNPNILTYQVICDESNNSPSVIKDNDLKCAVSWSRNYTLTKYYFFLSKDVL